MRSVRLFKEPVERWAFVKDGQPAFTGRRGWVAELSDGTHRYRVRRCGADPDVNEPIEIRPFLRIVSLRVVENGMRRPRLCRQARLVPL
uniref:Uncharacterized protein n=1 Tax=viral metagenome TaxID=1070528 RepID=A0A6H1ZIE9_9ZZZZ